jgi:hypothetical protein
MRFESTSSSRYHALIGASLPSRSAGVVLLVEVGDFRAAGAPDHGSEGAEGSNTGAATGRKMPSFRTGTRAAGSDTPRATGPRAELLAEMVVAHQPSDLLLLSVGRRYRVAKSSHGRALWGAPRVVIIGPSRAQFRGGERIKPTFLLLDE